MSPLARAYALLIEWSREENEQDANPVKDSAPCCNRCDEKTSQSQSTTAAARGQRGNDV